MCILCAEILKAQHHTHFGARSRGLGRRQSRVEKQVSSPFKLLQGDESVLIDVHGRQHGVDVAEDLIVVGPFTTQLLKGSGHLSRRDAARIVCVDPPARARTRDGSRMRGSAQHRLGLQDAVACNTRPKSFCEKARVHNIGHHTSP